MNKKIMKMIKNKQIMEENILKIMKNHNNWKILIKVVIVNNFKDQVF